MEVLQTERLTRARETQCVCGPHCCSVGPSCFLRCGDAIASDRIIPASFSEEPTFLA